MASISLKDVSLSLPIFGADSYSLKKTLVRATTGGRLQKNEGRICVDALTNINLELQDGDRIGLIGHNGAGKTTLLRVLAGIYAPTSGTFEIRGRIAPLLRPGIGITDVATGYENIKLCGLYLGLSLAEIDALIPEIAEFSELGDYLSMPTSTYSQGMLTRLSFAVVTAIHPDILLLDEALGAGDTNFQDKAIKRFNQLMDRAKILVLASHDENWIARSCNKVVLMDCGQITKTGPIDEVMEYYAKYVHAAHHPV